MSIIATVNLPDKFPESKRVRYWVESLHDVDVLYDDCYCEPPHVGKKMWIGCRQAAPHTDAYWRGKWFVTLSLVGGYEFGDVAQHKNYPGVPIRRGSVFIVQPMVLHWLFPQSQKDDAKPWFGLQWEVRPNQAPLVVRGLLQRFGGSLFYNGDKRYRNVLQKCQRA